MSGTVAGGVAGEGAGEDEYKVAVESAGAVTGTVRLPANAETTIAGKAGRVHYDNGGAVTVNANGEITGIVIDGTREAIRSDAGDLAVTVHGTVTGNIEGRGDGDLTVTVSESGTIAGEIFGRGGGVHTIAIADKATVLGTVHNPRSGTTISGRVGRVLLDNGGALTIAASGSVAGIEGEAIRSAAGDLTVTVAGKAAGRVESRGGALAATVTGTVEGDVLGLGAGEHTVAVRGGGMVTGTVRLAASEVNVEHGAAGRVLLDKGGEVKVGARGRISGLDNEGAAEAIRADAGDLTVSVASGGAVAGRIEGRGAGAMTVNVSGAVTGAIHGKGAGKHEVTVASGGAVTGDIVDMDAGDLIASVAGRVTGSIEERGAGDLTATVTGAVTGDIRGMGAGLHTVAVMNGGAVTGTVHLPTSAMMIAGRVGRVLYDNGGSISVAATGSIAGVETEGGGREAIRSAAGDLTVDVAAMATVTGDIRGDGGGDLDVDVSGTVKGGVFGRGGGEHDVHVKSGGAVEGLIHLEASSVTVDGSAGRVLFDRGGTVAVGSGGRITGLAGSAVHSAAGDLTMTVNGNVMGSVVAGDGAMDRLTVQSDGFFQGVTEGVEIVRIAGRAAGMLNLPGRNDVDISGELVGGEDEQGRRVAIVVETGPLNLNVDGKVEGAVDATDADAASTVAVGGDGAIDGKVTLAGAGSKIEVDGTARSVDVPRGAVTVGENGRIEEPVIGAVEVTVKAAPDESDEEAVQRVGDGRVGGGAAVTLEREGQAGRPLTVAADGRIRVGPEPRHRVYEGLPSVLLALNALPEFGGALASARAGAAARYELAANGDMAVARAADGRRGAWARLHAGGGDRRPASSVAGGAHDLRRYAFEAGMEGAAGDNALVSASVHHVRGEANMEGPESGGAEVSGTGARVAGAWFPAEGYYVGGQAAATLYEADLNSADRRAERGVLKRDVSGRGYTVGVEAGRRFDRAGMAVTPRARIDWSRIDMSPFTDAAGERVSLDGRSIKARAGVRVDTAALAGGLFATLDVERELSGSMRATAAREVLEAEAEATWLRLGLGGAHEWADGRFVLRGDANYAAARNGNRDFGGSASLTVRF